MNYRPSPRLQERHRNSYTGGVYNQCEGMRNLGRCVTNVKENQMNFSKRVFGKVLCWDCQQVERLKEVRK